MNLRKPEKAMQIYWTKRELHLILDALKVHGDSIGAFERDDVEKKCNLGIEAIEAYEKGDQLSMELLEVCQKQSESEALV